MDAEEYESSLDGRDYDFHGGYWDSSPVVIPVPYDARWYLVIDGYDGPITFEATKLVD